MAQKKRSVQTSSKQKRGGGSLPWIMLAVFVCYVIFALVFAVQGMDARVSFPAVGIFVLLEAALSALLFPVPLWIHGLIFIGQLALGLAFHMLPFMILMVIIYCLGIATLYFWTREEKA